MLVEMLKHICLYVKHTVPMDWEASLFLDSWRSPSIARVIGSLDKDPIKV